jgi:hypothetical protein
MQAKIKLWQRYRDEHKKATGLGDTVRKIEGLNKEDQFRLDKKQSATMLAIMNKWSSKPTLSEDEAVVVTKDINGMLTVKQIKKMTTMPTGFGRGGQGGGRPGGGPGGGGPRPGGPGGRPGGFTMPDPPKAGMNPFNPESAPPMFKERMKKNLSDFKAELAKQAH